MSTMPPATQIASLPSVADLERMYQEIDDDPHIAPDQKQMRKEAVLGDWVDGRRRQAEQTIESLRSGTAGRPLGPPRRRRRGLWCYW